MTTVVALGDSTTHCVGKSGVTEETAWRTLLAQDLAERLGEEVEVIDAGVNADVTPLVVERLEADVIARQPDVVTVMLGTNDAGYFRPPDTYADAPRVSIDEFEKHMRRIVGRIRQTGAGVVLCTSVPMSRNYWLKDLPAYVEHGLNCLVEQYANVTRRLAAEVGLPVAEVYEAFQQHPQRDEFIPDGIHPDRRGQRLIADTILPVLEATIQARRRTE